MKRKSLLYKLIIINAIILGFILHFLAFALSLWFKGNFFDEKKTLFQDTGSYLSRAVKYHNKSEIDLRIEEFSIDKIQTSISHAARDINYQITHLFCFLPLLQ